MSVKGRYFFNEGEEDSDEYVFYEKYRFIS